MYEAVYVCIYVDSYTRIWTSVWIEIGKHVCTHAWMDGFRQNQRNLCMYLYVCKKVNMFVYACIQIHIDVHPYRMQFLTRCLSNKMCFIDVKEQIWLPSEIICDSLITSWALVICVKIHKCV